MNLLHLVRPDQETFSQGMAVPKKRRSKMIGKRRLANWKGKAADAAAKAFNVAKTTLNKEKQVISSEGENN